MRVSIYSALIIAALALTPGGMANADESGFYVDGGYTHISTDANELGVATDLDLGAIGGRVGYDFSAGFGIEGEALFGISDESVTDGITPANVSLTSAFGVYGKLQAPISDRFSLHGRAGLIQAELEAESTTGPRFSASASELGFGYGVGAKIYVTGNAYVRGDVTRYDIDGTEIDAFSLAIGTKF